MTPDGGQMTDNQGATRGALQVITVVALLLIVSPVLVLVIMVVEHSLFGTRHFTNGLEAIGLTKVLEAMFNALGING